jgi:addiction module HigA family antidote
MSARKRPPVHPGEILLEGSLKPFGIGQYRAAMHVDSAPRRINESVSGTHAITAEMALRLARFFGSSGRFWFNLQMRYDPEVENRRLAGVLGREVRSLANSE